MGTDKVQNGSKPSENSVCQCSGSQPVARDPKEVFLQSIIGCRQHKTYVTLHLKALCIIHIKGIICNALYLFRN